MDERKKKIMAGVLGVLAIGALVFGGWQAWLRVPPSMPEDVGQVEALLNDPRYLRLAAADKRRYQERINEMWGSLDDDGKQRLGKLIRSSPDSQDEGIQQMRLMYKTMVIDQSEAGRNVTMDMMINAMEANGGRERMQQGADRERTPEEQEREAEGRKKMWEFLDSGDPQGLGYGSEFFKLMQQRRVERGLPPL